MGGGGKVGGGRGKGEGRGVIDIHVKSEAKRVR